MMMCRDFPAASRSNKEYIDLTARLFFFGLARDDLVARCLIGVAEIDVETFQKKIDV